MKQWKKRGVAIAAVLSLAAATLTGCAGRVNPEETLVTVGEEKVTYGVVNYFARLQQAQYENYYASMLGTSAKDFWGKESSDKSTYEDTIKEGIMDDIKELYVIKQHAAEYDVKLTEEEEDAIAKAAKQFVEDNEKDVVDAVSGEEKYVKEYLTLITIEKKMEPFMTEGVSEEVSDEEAAQKAMDYIYVTYTKKDKDGKNISMSDEEKETLKKSVQAAVDKLKSGEEKLSAVAEEFNVSVQKATFDADSYSPNANLVKAADALAKEGDVTELVETDNGIYVGTLTSLLDRDATDKKKTSIVQQRKNDQFTSLVKQWIEETEIKVDEKLWKKVDFKTLGVEIKRPAAE